ncbi:MAG: efflux RND transporter periplasmic adaptor subunit [Pseudomonadota bacterium]|nr:efflux RND transporter periplasmic adaptor subunit [Pseudomonadota bacterium]
MKISSPNLKGAVIKIAILLVCVSFGWYLKGRLSPSLQGMGYGMGEVYILAQKSENKDITSAQTKISYVESINEVNILPQITGTVEKVLFQEGKFVKEGDILFEIDPSKYQAAYDLAKAQLDSAKANLVKSERDYNRQVKLSSEKFASKATFDLSESAYLQAKASVEEAQANLDLAKIDLDNTKVIAPISGRIGKALVTKGNYVVASNQVLAKIVQISPMRISFSLTDKEVLQIKKAENANENLIARITLANGEVIDEKVVDRFLNNEINSATATVSIFVDVDNAEHKLIPGNYVQSAILTGKPTYAVVVPQSALNYDTDGAFVYIAKIDENKSNENDLHGVAEQRRVVLGDPINENEQIIINGLKEGEMIVVSGNVKIQNNSPIKIGVLEK